MYCYGLINSRKGCPASIKRELFGCEATNDYSESSLGGTTQEINKFGGIVQHNAAAVRDNRRNEYWVRFGAGGDKQKKVSTNSTSPMNTQLN